MINTNIEWTDSTWNIVRGCARVSEGCRHCYAETIAHRFSKPGQPYHNLIATGGQWNGRVITLPEKLLEPYHWAKPRRVFVCSTSDLFHPSVPFKFIAAAFFIMSITTRHTYQVLTKRPERMRDFFNWVHKHSGAFNDDRITSAAYATPEIDAMPWRRATAHHGGYDSGGPTWPYTNIQLGVSVENQTAAHTRIDALLDCPAALRFLSVEPLLGPVSLKSWPLAPAPWPGINWVIAGGESGPGARPPHPGWLRDLRDQCRARSVPFFFKQWGAWAPADIDPSGDMFYHHHGRKSGMPKYKGAAVSRVDGQCSHDANRLNDPATTAVMYRVGKKRAGCQLDGETLQQLPAPSDIAQAREAAAQ